MLKKNKTILRLSFLAIAFFVSSILVNAAETVRFKVSVDATAIAQNQPLAGRLLIFMTAQRKSLDVIEPDFLDPQSVYVAGIEAKNMEAGKFVEINADNLAFPKAFSEAPAGDYQVMALLDRDHSYTYDGMGAGDVYSSVAQVKIPSSAPVELTLSKQVPETKVSLPKGVQIVEFESPALSAFWGRPVKMQASVVLPPSYDASKAQKYPTVYAIHGYGGNHLKSLRGVPVMLKAMAEGKRPEMIYVYLDAQCSLGHHVFANSANNGPWGTALTKEFIPYLERQFRMDAKPSGRFLTGHSSGGWSTLWVMINNPDFFGGTWSTSPDPVDFHSFSETDLTSYPPQNFYRNAGGKPYNLVRAQGREIMSFEEYARLEQAEGYFGGQMASFEAVFGPKGADGQPMPLFDRETGRIDPFVQKAWERYDISKILQKNWTTLAPKLKGKLHIWVGTADTFHLDGAVRLLDAKLKALGSDARIEYLEGRSHFDLYKDGLGDRIAQEMYAVARPKAKAATK